MPREQTPKPDLPAWFRCDVCQLNRAGHDTREQKIPPLLRHDFVSVTEQRRRLERQRSEQQHDQLITTTEGEGTHV